jgi:hypothetical protein
MRTVLLLAAVGVVSMFGLACGDASDTDPIAARRHNAGGTEDPNAPHDPSASDVGEETGQTGAPTLPDKPSDPGTAAATFDLAVSNATPAADLGTSVSLDVTLTPKAAFDSAVTLEVTGLPANVTPTFSPASLTVSGMTAVKTTLKLDVGYTAPTTPKDGAVPIVIKATAGGATATANANFKVNAQLTLNIPMNAAALRDTKMIYRDQWGSAFGSTPQPLLTQADNPIGVLVKNTDSVPQEIHSGNLFGHGVGLIQPGEFDKTSKNETRVRMLNVGNSINGYLHNDGDVGGDGKGVAFQIKVAAAPAAQ